MFLYISKTSDFIETSWHYCGTLGAIVALSWQYYYTVALLRHYSCTILALLLNFGRTWVLLLYYYCCTCVAHLLNYCTTLEAPLQGTNLALLWQSLGDLMALFMCRHEKVSFSCWRWPALSWYLLPWHCSDTKCLTMKLLRQY